MEKKDKFAYHIGNKFFCEDCLSEEEVKGVKEKISVKDLARLEDIQCDKCRMKLN